MAGVKSFMDKSQEISATPQVRAATADDLKGYPPGTVGKVDYKGELVNVYNPSEDQNRAAHLILDKQNAALHAQEVALSKQRLEQEFSTTGQLSPDAIQQAAEAYVTTGQLPSFGMGKNAAALRTVILNKAGEINKAGGVSGYGQAANAVTFKANKDALVSTGKLASSTRAFENTANANADLALSLAPGGAGPNQAPIFNRWIQAGRKDVAGDPAVTKFNLALGTFLDEYAKVVSGNGSRGSTDASRKEAYDRLSKYSNLAQLQGGIATMKQEMANRSAGFDKEAADLTAQMNHAPGAAPTAPAPSAPAPASSGGWGVPKVVQH